VQLRSEQSQNCLKYIDGLNPLEIAFVFNTMNSVREKIEKIIVQMLSGIYRRTLFN